MVLEVVEVVVHREYVWYIGHLFGTWGQLFPLHKPKGGLCG